LDSRRAHLILNLLPGIGSQRVNQLLSLTGDVSGIFAMSESELSRVPGIGGRLAQVIARWSEHCDPDEEQTFADRAGVRLVVRSDPDYPELLGAIPDPPLCLYVRGDVVALTKLHSSIAIVGSRRTTRYGVKMAELLGSAAALAGWTVVSGLARGIDTVAHESTLAAGGCTIAVLGSGLARVYPQENVELARRIATCGGALVSEFPMRFPPDKRTFPMRNRIISGLTLGTIVVEAGVRSGALITASAALDQGRQVFAVPGPADSPQSRGCHALLKDGARLVETYADVLEEFSGLPGLLATVPRRGPCAAAENGSEPENPRPGLQLTELEGTILVLLARGDAGIDELIVGCEASAGDVLSSIVQLEMKHLVRQLPGRRVARATGAAVG